MATSSFTRSFRVKHSESQKFAQIVTSGKKAEPSKGFNTNYSHPSNYSESLRKALKK